MPQDIEQAFTAAGVSLFPASRTSWTPIARARIGPTRASTWRPRTISWASGSTKTRFLLFRLRGRTQEQVMTALRARRAGAEEVAEPAHPRRRKRCRHWRRHSRSSGVWASRSNPSRSASRRRLWRCRYCAAWVSRPSRLPATHCSYFGFGLPAYLGHGTGRGLSCHRGN